mmetsp:Transcript_2054/g.3276  ORF Transcript_2054/g.3276 Transcript_2054/m.3276 type:complete len:214 (+) Transcript_2054:184-825(+)
MKESHFLHSPFLLNLPKSRLQVQLLVSHRCQRYPLHHSLQVSPTKTKNHQVAQAQQVSVVSVKLTKESHYLPSRSRQNRISRIPSQNLQMKKPLPVMPDFHQCQKQLLFILVRSLQKKVFLHLLAVSHPCLASRLHHLVQILQLSLQRSLRLLHLLDFRQCRLKPLPRSVHLQNQQLSNRLPAPQQCPMDQRVEQLISQHLSMKHRFGKWSVV